MGRMISILAMVLSAALAAGLLTLAETSREAEAAFPGQNGKIAFVDELGDIFAINPDGSAQTNLTDSPTYDRNPAFSPDGDRIAFDSTSGDCGDGVLCKRDIHVINQDGTAETNFTQTPDIIESDPAWSPNGNRIAFVVGTEQQENASIWAMNADGTAEARKNSAAASVEAQPDWQPLVGNSSAVQFDPATYNVDEAAGTSTITVTRTDASDGAVPVDYASSDDTASAASPYTATSGTLDFAAGETSETFAVPIHNDAGDEPDETVNLTLSNPTRGASLGESSSSVMVSTAVIWPPNEAPTVTVA